MKVLHVKNVQSETGFGLRNLVKSKTETHIYYSGFWDIPVEEAESLIGGMLYLHETKAKPSRFGGRVLSVEQVEKPELARSQRVVFKVEATLEGKNVKWRGANHGMASYGGILEVED